MLFQNIPIWFKSIHREPRKSGLKFKRHLLLPYFLTYLYYCYEIETWYTCSTRKKGKNLFWRFFICDLTQSFYKRFYLFLDLRNWNLASRYNLLSPKSFISNVFLCDFKFEVIFFSPICNIATNFKLGTRVELAKISNFYFEDFFAKRIVF